MFLQNVPQVDEEGFCIRPEVNENDILFCLSQRQARLLGTLELLGFFLNKAKWNSDLCPCFWSEVVAIILLNFSAHMPKRIPSTRPATRRTKTNPGSSTCRSSPFSQTTAFIRTKPTSMSSRPPLETSSCRLQPRYSSWHSDSTPNNKILKDKLVATSPCCRRRLFCLCNTRGHHENVKTSSCRAD